jgi:hypothetical protein
MALPEGIRVNDDGDVVFEGAAGRMLLSHVVMHAKFARPFEPIMFLNAWLAELAVGLRARVRAHLSIPEGRPGTPMFGDDPRVRWEIAEVILMEADHSGWWTWSREQQVNYIRNVACAPHPVSDETVDEVLFAIEDKVALARRLVAGADRGV